MVKMEVSKRALIQRINRKLRADADGDSLANQVKTARGAKARQQVGEYYLLNPRRNSIVETNIDLEQMGRKLEVLANWERLVD